MMRKKITAVFAAFFICITVFCFPCFASSPSVYIIDDARVMSEENERKLESKAKEAASKTGFNIVIISSNDIGTPKTDAHVVEFADDKYEELCGIETNGILFLINCDTKYDYISTSGDCIEYFSDYRIESIFDEIWDDMKAERFSQAAYGFIECVEYYYDQGRANHDLHPEYTVTREPENPIANITSITLMEFLHMLGLTAFFSLIIGTGIYSGNAKQFKVEKPGTRNYILDNSLVFDNKSDVFVGRVVNKTYSPRTRSSSSGSSHRSSHHSSIHHSHSGGRHGGGGRHR
ncbi:MAG: TPM domain-containing protein [Ruminiclostridium sp.]|nr:TPM domain-containing protein [Ruminiclostridium sp.]